MLTIEQIEFDVHPLGDIEPIGDGHRRVRHRACGSQIAIRNNPASAVTYSMRCPHCGPLGEVRLAMVDCIDYAAIRGDGAPVIIDVWR